MGKTPSGATQSIVTNLNFINMNLILRRVFSDDTQTLGVLLVVSDHGLCYRIFSTIELPYLANQKNVSSIPEGVYKIRERYSYKFGNHLEVLGVPGRSLILLHYGNYKQDTQGCILVGQYHQDINNDGNLDVVNSKKSMQDLLKILGGQLGVLRVINTHK